MPVKETQNHVIATLEKLGLGENEALLYSLMLRQPKSTVQELQVRAPFPRTMLYYVLNHLIQRGLVTAVKEGWRTVYVAESPERLYEMLAHRERGFAQDADMIRELIPKLKQQYRLAGQRPDVRVFEGIEAYKKVLDDIVFSQPERVLAYSAIGMAQKPGIEIRETFERQRVTRKIQKQTLLVDTADVRQELSTYVYNDYTQFRLMADSLEVCAVDMQLYAGKILYVTYDGRDPIATLIEDQAFFHMQRRLFKWQWSQGTDATLLRYHKF